MGISFALILSGILIFVFSFVLKFGRKNFDRDFSQALRNFERQKTIEEFNENINDQAEKSDNIKENLYDNDSEKIFSEEEIFDMPDYDADFENDDDDFSELMRQSKAFIRLAGAALIVIGIISYFINL